ncbi:hypothetical protein [Endozoicomonas lisbonensis]|uniref:Ribosomal protein L37E n=1 Tax=Endozoicomonas lisbonensis TaxID=3120522 RepID=A0ABV2SCJ4_9GAMM
MNPKQLMLLLNPKGQSWSPAPRNAGKAGTVQSQLRWEDVASALGAGQLAPLSYYLVRAKYCQDDSSVEPLLALVLKETSALAKANRWQARKDTLQSLAHLACYESLDTQLCKSCGGRGYSQAGKACRVCRGYGRHPMSARARYRMAGIDKRNWERRWLSRYEQLYQALCDAEDCALAHLSHQLGS